METGTLKTKDTKIRLHVEVSGRPWSSWAPLLCYERYRGLELKSRIYPRMETVKTNFTRFSFQGLPTQDKKGHKENFIIDLSHLLILCWVKREKKISFKNLLPIDHHYRSLQSKSMLPLNNNEFPNHLVSVMLLNSLLLLLLSCFSRVRLCATP